MHLAVVRTIMTTKGRVTLVAAAAALAGLALAACGGTTATGSASAGGAPKTTSAAGSSGSSTSTAAMEVVVTTANVPGLGTVLVDGSGRTYYILTSEKGGRITCTDATGCTKYWPDTSLPAGVKSATAGSGVNASLLGTVKGADGEFYVTYSSYPLYRFSGDSSPGVAHGEGIKSFGGTWYVMAPGGDPVTAAAAQSPSTTAPAYSGSGY
ncbi:MAG TPA: hypothetical protein VE990_04565 [Acidimicrobiales bacterium]|nr:hypothetical protein [Acidimicrobiales bacterium]